MDQLPVEEALPEGEFTNRFLPFLKLISSTNNLPLRWFALFSVLSHIDGVVSEEVEVHREG